MKIEELMNQISHPEDVTSSFYPDDIKMNQASGIFASFPVLFWLPLVIAKDSPYGKFCANQGLILFVLNLTLNFAAGILRTVWSHIPLIGGILSLIISLAVFAATTGAFLLLLISACQGKARKIPLIGNMIEAFR